MFWQAQRPSLACWPQEVQSGHPACFPLPQVLLASAGAALLSKLPHSLPLPWLHACCPRPASPAQSEAVPALLLLLACRLCCLARPHCSSLPLESVKRSR
ncbi:hypothetical protein BCR37DRAFT_381021 [Protomyces lactucae-debilis]|uniref:Uncharacterized protein n=1 Tax=Protomyces lactucae-debilis TaxID=2754530 RepID=A0A1Y2FBX2_PROLT|nr:uncharacterized protein BCR37DRAFT_381021 [Protomyces lactucae-debilis]ORY80355.1 hypothetical protein BCR37DRAFT_381021 [Protomyces lactucae-debilis]